MAIVAKYILLEFAPIMPAFCPLPSYFSKNYVGKIGASLDRNKGFYLKCVLNTETAEYQGHIERESLQHDNTLLSSNAKLSPFLSLAR